jgi:glucokinase
LDIVDEACSYLGYALAMVAQVVDPEAFVIGGGVSKAGDILISHIKKHYVPNVMNALKDRVFALASLGNDAGIYGCARLILSS